MKKIVLGLFALLFAFSAHATPSNTVKNGLTGLGMSSELADYLAPLVTSAPVFNNNTYIKFRNAADTANLSVLKADASDNTVLNAGTGKNIQLAFNGTADATFTAGRVTVATAAYQVVPGATSFSFLSNSAGSTNLLITDAGKVTVRDTLNSTGLIFPVANYEAVAGAGTTVADAAALSATKHIHQITGANGTVGWKFAAPGPGAFEILLNTTAGVAKIYAEAGGTVNGGSADAAFSALTGIKPILCFCTATSTWICS